MTNGNDPINAADPSIHSFAGLTKREYFAAMAMQGLIASGATIDIDKEYPFQARAYTCIVMADALIKALNNE